MSLDAIRAGEPPCLETRGNAIKPVVLNIRYFELKKPKTGMSKRQMLSICQKEGYSVAELTDIQNELR